VAVIDVVLAAFALMLHSIDNSIDDQRDLPRERILGQILESAAVFYDVSIGDHRGCRDAAFCAR
jgi:hypothetical protein